LEGSHSQERTPAFASATEPIAADLFCPPLREPHDFLKGFQIEPAVHLLAEGAQIKPSGLIITGQMDVIPDPVQIDRRIDAIILEQRDGYARNGGGFHIRKGAFQDGQTTDPNDRLDLASLDE